SQLENIFETILAVSLKRVRTGAWLVGTHTCTSLTIGLEHTHHFFDRLTSIDGAKSGENIQSVLPETNSLVVEMCRPVIVFVSTQHSVLLRDSNHAFDPG